VDSHDSRALEGATPVAVVTGAAGGIGRAICDELAAEYLIVACDRSGPALDGLACAFQDAGSRHAVQAFDLQDASACQTAVDWISDRFGRLDVLINNAGAWHYERFLESTDDHWLEVIEVNVLAPVRLIRLAVPLLRESPRPRVVNVSSKNAFYGEYGLSSYDVSKAALTALTRSLALELGEFGILVNAVCPGVVATESNQQTLDDPQASAAYVRQIPLGRFCEPSEVARAVRFLASPDLTYASGSALLLDGGQMTGDRPEHLGPSIRVSNETEPRRTGVAS
jgi:NAD(P)-dependent dehydrogenase (short-subunit alcohol dehydrogenase family)